MKMDHLTFRLGYYLIHLDKNLGYQLYKLCILGTIIRVILHKRAIESNFVRFIRQLEKIIV